MKRYPVAERGPLRSRSAALILAAVVIAYGSQFWPGRIVLAEGLKLLGYPPYAGFVGLFLPHLLLYSTLSAAVSAVLWWALAHIRALPSSELGNISHAILPGIIGGLGALAASLLVALAIFPPGTVHWVQPVAWKIAGNVFSNFYEEFVFRGFLLVALGRLAGFWPAALVSSVAWAVLHTQYPLLGQLSIVLIGVGFCWLARFARSIWAPYIAHEVLDLLGDSLIG